jgi:GMP synthase-like glutamine amidotransferase
MSARALILQHGDWGPPGVLAEWADARGIGFDVHHAEHSGDLPPLNGQAFVASLGSPHNPSDIDVPQVQAEMAWLRQAIEHDVPVLGLCFGGQALAAALGGTIERAPQAELGWCAIRSRVPDEVPEGPWLQWHYDRFTLPPGAEQLAESDAGVQAFRHGRHLGVQFHPESTIEIVRLWALSDRDRLGALGIEDGEALLERGRHHAAAARDAAFRLFDAFWQRART